jgi:hypothetical protein
MPRPLRLNRPRAALLAGCASIGTMSALDILWLVIRNFPVYPVLGVLTYVVLNDAYRGPLAAFPRPKMAALTRWYATWVEVVRGTSWTAHLRELHGVYGGLVCQRRASERRLIGARTCGAGWPEGGREAGNLGGAGLTGTVALRSAAGVQ